MANLPLTLEQNFLQDLIRQSIEQQIATVLETLTQDPVWLERTDRLINRAIIQRAKETVEDFNIDEVVRECVKENIGQFESRFTQQVVESISENSNMPDSDELEKIITQVVQNQITDSVQILGQDPVWLEKIERMINQAVVQRTVAKIASTDINTVIHQRVDENLETVHRKFMQNFKTNGISDQATAIQLTVMDENVVVENQLVAKDLRIVGTAQVNDLTVTGSINTDNRSWHDLAREISRRTLDDLDDNWRDRLVAQVSAQIQAQGIDFERVTVDGTPLISGKKLNSGITESNLQHLGNLQDLQVRGEAHIYNTLSVVNRRIGVNTTTPESALSVWDEEVSVIIGKYKSKQGYVGTSRDQGLVLGVNREPQIEIDPTGLTRIKRLQVGLHKISHDTQVPGWSGTRGDIVFNSSPGPDRVFAWICLGGHKWQTIKSAE